MLGDIRTPGHYAGGSVGDFERDGAPDVFILGGGGVADALFINGDGWTDIYVVSGGDLSGPDRPGEHMLYRNEGDGSFSEVANSAGVNFTTTIRTTMSSAWGDYDLDGDLDLMVMTWSVSGAANRLFRNNGNETFSDVTSPAGINSGWGFTPRFVDMNGDRYPELLLVSDFGDGSLTPLPHTAGVQDGGWGWGAETLDFDHDGFIDIAETNGRFDPEYSHESSHLYRSAGDMSFTRSELPKHFEGRALMTLDYDLDGDMDTLITMFNGSTQLWRNDLAAADTNWIEIELDTDARADLAPHGVGSRIQARTGGIVQTFYMSRGGTYLGQSERLVHFGLGAATSIDELTLKWSDGSTTVLSDLPANLQLTLTPTIPGVPGEASAPDDPADQLRVGRDHDRGLLTLHFAPACGAVNHTLYHGELAALPTGDYSGAICGLGNSGTAHVATAGCDLPQGLNSACD